MKIFATNHPAIPAAVEKITEKEVPGRNGTLHIKSGTFQNTEIPVEFNYIGKKEQWNERWRMAKQWLSATDATLSFGDDSEFFYKISRVILGSNARVSEKIGRFSAGFITKDGLSYYKSGKNEMTISEAKNNPGIVTQPNYIITGEGVCTLTVNGKTMKANVSKDIVINTELMLAYHLDKTSQNTAVSGNYEDLYLQEGMNEISVTEGFECKIIPNWRCL